MILLLSILLGIVIILLGVTLAETILWWCIWKQEANRVKVTEAFWGNAIVFLTGISDYAAESLDWEQIEFLREMENRRRTDIMVAEPFPYQKSVPLQFAKFEVWRYWGFKQPPLWWISLHNFWQTGLAVGWEKAYGTGVARCIINRIGLTRSPNSMLIIVCGSAGATLALAAAPMLKEYLQSRITIISYGGVFRSSPGFDFVDNFYHLLGEKDNWAKLGEIVFPGRFLSLGSYAKAKQENRFSWHYTGKHEHLGYLSDRTPPSHTKTYRELTLDTVTSLPFWQEK